jgi:hypothetical protein
MGKAGARDPLQSSETSFEWGAAGGDGETGGARDAKRGRFGGDGAASFDSWAPVSSTETLMTYELSVSVERALRRAASASAIIGMGDAIANVVGRRGDWYFVKSDRLFHRAARGEGGTLDAGDSSQPLK